MKYSNYDLEDMAKKLEPVLNRSDLLGYVAARNYKLILDTVNEYVQIKNDLVRRYGEPAKDGDGNETGEFSISTSDPRFAEFKKDFEEIATYEHEIEFHKVPAERCIDALTGRQILDIDFMLEYND